MGGLDQAATARFTPTYTPARVRHLTGETLRAGGPRALFWNALAVAGARRLLLYRMRREDVLARRAPVPGIAVRALSESEIPAYLAMRPGTAETEVLRRLRVGSECVAAWTDGRLVAARWLARGRADVPYLGVSFQLGPGISYAHDAFTEPEQRRRGVSALVTAELVERAFRGGASAVINAVLPENRGGQGLARGRSQRLGVLRSLRLGRWRIVDCRVPPGYLAAPAALGTARRS
jgi:GNAT superfamily N-acetyltransferase